MCVVSMVMDHYHEKWTPLWTQPLQPAQPSVPIWTQPPPTPKILQEEVDEFRRLLKRAREYDRRMGEPDCELAEKKDALKKIAKALGVDISFVDEEQL